MESEQEYCRDYHISMSDINPKLIESQFANRGAIVERMYQIKAELRNGSSEYPFNEFMMLNTGNPHSFGQPPVSFFREVLACLMRPELIDKGVFHDDVNKRAKKYIEKVGSVGCYVTSKGVSIVRHSITDFIKERDGVESIEENIMVTNGASDAITLTLNILNHGPECGFMVPIPIYPLYSALMTLHNNHLVGYYLDEENHWGLNIEELERSITEAKAKGIAVKAIVIINPGNPTGGIFSEDDLKNLCEFAYKHRIAIMADEVYQENVYNPDLKFISVRKVLSTMIPKIRDSVAVFSYHSCSKGFIGECGVRAGYVELHNICPLVNDQFRKYTSFSLCSNVPGQFLVALMVDPPKRGRESDETVDIYEKEKADLLGSLKRRAIKCSEAMSAMKNCTCQPIDGAMYAFPKIELPQKLIDEAIIQGIEPDLLYCKLVLNKTGMVVVPGSGFKQLPGTYHFRTTILPLPEDKFNEAFSALKTANDEIMDAYA